MRPSARPLVGIPIKPFGVAKQRLHPLVTAEARSVLGKAIAARTAAMAQLAEVDVVIVTGDDGVGHWSGNLGLSTIREGAPGSGLNGAARALRNYAHSMGQPWLLLHADLPLIQPPDIAALVGPLLAGTGVISPSYDGGTSALGNAAEAIFSYGAGSYHRHLRSLTDATVVVRPGLAFDLDTAADLGEISRHRDGEWILGLLAAIDSTP